MNHRIIKIFVEGAEPSTRRSLENSFRSLLHELCNQTDQKVKVQIVASGCRPDCYKYFAAEFTSRKPNTIPVLLVDSETRYDFGDPQNSPKRHIHTQEQFKNLKNDSIADERFYLMTTAMESWILSDIDAIRRFFENQNLEESQLKDIVNELESFVTASTTTDSYPKSDIEKLFKSLCQTHLGKSYKKTSHAFEMLKFVKATTAKDRSESFRHFHEGLCRLINSDAQV